MTDSDNFEILLNKLYEKRQSYTFWENLPHNLDFLYLDKKYNNIPIGIYDGSVYCIGGHVKNIIMEKNGLGLFGYPFYLFLSKIYSSELEKWEIHLLKQFCLKKPVKTNYWLRIIPKIDIIEDVNEKKYKRVLGVSKVLLNLKKDFKKLINQRRLLTEKIYNTKNLKILTDTLNHEIDIQVEAKKLKYNIDL